MSNVLKVLNPYDQSPIGELPLIDESKALSFLSDANELQSYPRKLLPKSERIRILRETAKIMESSSSELAYLIASEGGKPLIDSKIEVERAIDGVNTCANDLSALIGKEIPMGLTTAAENRISFSTREPIGSVVAISAFNHPLNLIVHQVAPAVAVGCPVIVKPADDTPLSCQKFLSTLYEAGLPEKWARFAPCSIPVAQKLVTDPSTAFFSFIGSAKVGWYLKSVLSPGTRFALEHGGAAPVIVGKTASMDDVIPKLVKGGYYHSGQVCVSVQRVFVVGDAKELAEKISISAKELKVGNAVDESTECGPLIRVKEVERVDHWVKEAEEGGGQVICGGKRISESTYSPTVILNPPHDSKVSRLEIFGPVICVYSCESIEEALSRANSLEYAFQAAVFSNDFAEIMTVFNGVDATAVMINDHTAFRVDWMPFAGRKQSGYGTGGIGYTMEDMTQLKMGVINY
ncbi:MAG: aldehyde dehydrogenase [Betaproteobacteria bacterium TMED82]|nr:MAG: aldehyde dehydrogenase [Betaproteobacteria bacterium TMED82]|tara:strand:+ start:43192 stop:44574 length:1383 start_codon:yes stop_codon:yes gene_type:complete